MMTNTNPAPLAHIRTLVEAVELPEGVTVRFVDDRISLTCETSYHRNAKTCSALVWEAWLSVKAAILSEAAEGRTFKIWKSRGFTTWNVHGPDSGIFLGKRAGFRVNLSDEEKGFIYRGNGRRLWG